MNNFSNVSSPAELNVSYGAGPERTLDIYSPTHPANGRPVLIFFHGGFWQSGDKSDYAFIGQTMASKGILTLVANYSLYPNSSFPDFLHDGADTISWAREHAAEYGGNPKRLYLMGHSAGAYIALMLALDPEYLSQDGLATSSIAGVIGVSGLYDFLPLDNKSFAPIFATAPDLLKTQPVHFATSDAPPVLLISSESDDKIDPRNTETMADYIRAKNGKVKVSFFPQTGHIGILLPFSPLFHGKSGIVTEVTDFILNQQDSDHAQSN